MILEISWVTNDKAWSENFRKGKKEVYIDQGCATDESVEKMKRTLALEIKRDIKDIKIVEIIEIKFTKEGAKK
ncbi:MAG: hypothetical protein DRQ88_06015 [Epsilonproteobacteria bacterium]|nr:MAG: hypothetical protein DRQ88_06015 [Campylobacterota bacterium]